MVKRLKQAKAKKAEGGKSKSKNHSNNRTHNSKKKKDDIATKLLQLPKYETEPQGEHLCYVSQTHLNRP